jgi:hypothetical protein
VHFRISIALSLLLAACGQDVRALRLDQVDLSDMTVVQQLGEELDPADRSAFTTFAALHGRAAAGNCGLTVGGQRGKAPETIGEAIEAMQTRLAQFQPPREAAPVQATAAPSVGNPPAAYTGASLEEVNRQLDIIGR